MTSPVDFISGPRIGSASGNLVNGNTASFTEKRSEEHTSELQSQSNIVCRLLLEKQNKTAGIGVVGQPTEGRRGSVPPQAALWSVYATPVPGTDARWVSGAAVHAKAA